MSDKPIRPELRFLLDAERTRPAAPDQARAAVQGKLAALLGPSAGLASLSSSSSPASPGSPASPATPAQPRAPGATTAAAKTSAVKAAGAIGTANAIGALLVSAAIGASAMAYVHPTDRVVYVDRGAASTPLSPVAPTACASSIVTVREPPVSTPVSTMSASPSALASAEAPRATSHATDARSSQPRDGELSAERALVERARSALARGDGAGALAAVELHEKTFPRGQLVEEREVLAVQALVAAGRTKDAAARGALFRRRFPNSVLLPLVDHALR